MLHDLRRTPRTRLEGLQVLTPVSEKLLGHKLQGVLKTYNRHDYFDAMGDALNRLEAEIIRIVDPPSGSNVVPIRAAVEVFHG